MSEQRTDSEVVTSLETDGSWGCEVPAGVMPSHRVFVGLVEVATQGEAPINKTELAKVMGVSRTLLWRLESGQSEIRMDHIVALLPRLELGLVVKPGSKGKTMIGLVTKNAI